jgi:heptose I phosphotransferase
MPIIKKGKQFWLAPALIDFFPKGEAGFAAVMSLRGEIYRQVGDRYTMRIVINHQVYFLKIHAGVTWREIGKNFLYGRLPVIGARREALALAALNAAGIRVPRLAGYGASSLNPFRQCSFVLMEAVPTNAMLATLADEQLLETLTFERKRALIYAVAHIARLCHQLGIYHRDFYLCHFLLQEGTEYTKNPLIYIIDWHRAGISSVVPKRWLIKDLAGLYFSSRNKTLSRQDELFFVKVYSGMSSLRHLTKSAWQFWDKVVSRGTQLYRRHQ